MDFFGMLLEQFFIYKRLVAHLAPKQIIIMDSLDMLMHQCLLRVNVFAALPITRVSPSNVTFFLMLGQFFYRTKNFIALTTINLCPWWELLLYKTWVLNS